MTTETEALRLAELFEFESDPDSLYRKAAAELRRLHEVEKHRDELLAALKLIASHAKWLASSTSDFIAKAERTTT